jgi:micrococcal nuclease
MNVSIRCTHLLFVAFLSTSSLASAEKVKSVEDGNTMTIVLDDQPVMLRLAHIDAPEKKQAFGEASRKSLAELCLGKNAVLQNKQLDYSGTLVAVVQCDGNEANRIQVERGLAWVDPKHNNDLTLPALEAMARRDRRGLWSDDDPIAPWKFRKPARKARLAHIKQSDDAICFVDKWGSYRIVDGDRRYGC